MRAVRFEQFGRPEVLQIVEVAQPRPRAGEILIRVQSSSLNSADIGARSGESRIHARRLPMTPGYDVAGTVVACGAAVTSVLPGEHVFALTGLRAGGHAEYICLPHQTVARVPRRISLTEAGGVPLAGLTALQALRGKARLQPGQRVLINGASGGVGAFAVQIAKRLQGHVTAVCSRGKQEFVAGLGADELIDYAQHDFTTSRQRWDVVIDAAGNRRFRHVWRVLNPRGIMVATRPDLSGAVPMLVGKLGIGPRYAFLITQARSADLACLAALIDAGELQPVVDRIFPLTAIQEANRYFEAGKAQGKVVIQIGPS